MAEPEQPDGTVGPTFCFMKVMSDWKLIEALGKKDEKRIKSSFHLC